MPLVAVIPGERRQRRLGAQPQRRDDGSLCSVPNEGWLQLGDAVRHQRGIRRETQTAFARRIGVAPRTLRSIEKGERRHYRAETVIAVETAMAWAPGSVERIVNNQQPIDEPRFERLRAMWPSLSSDTRRMVIEFAEREFERG